LRWVIDEIIEASYANISGRQNACNTFLGKAVANVLPPNAMCNMNFNPVSINQFLVKHVLGVEITKVNPFPALQVLQISQNFPQEQPLVLTWGTFAQTKRTTGQPIQGSYHPLSPGFQNFTPKGLYP
jgi:hypothetical protein